MTMEHRQPREIDGKGRTVRELLAGRKYSIDYYQREYKWQTKQIQELIEDLTEKFLASYDRTQDRSMVETYGHYFLGSIVISHKDGKSYIIDGQQRLTSLTLFAQALSPWAAMAIVGQMLMAVGFSICQPATTSLISRSTKAQHQGAMLGVNAAAGALARITGPVIAGVLFAPHHIDWPFLFAGAGTIPAVWLALRAGQALKAHRARI